ncbi:caspase family protein [Streptomyces albovinaceus]|uniref:caspase family protein n=1 Tax=Streptomyces albovinaceus TaxID=66867 RepID=UPI000A3CF57D|nr:caspase family protein [Streptomyces albovinaceus]
MTASVHDAAGGEEGPRRFLIATAVARYPKCPEWDRPGLVKARDRIIELFTGKLGYCHETALGLDPTKTQLTDHLRAFCTSPERREDDLVVVYLSGHGEVLEDGGEHVLLMSDADPADVTYTALATADLVRVLRGTRIRRLLLILDTCYSGQGGNELAAAALERLGAQWGQRQSSSGLVIVSSAQPHQQAQPGVFPDLLEKAVSSRATAGHAPTHLSVSAVVQQINDHPDKPGYQRVSLSLLGLSGEPPDFLTNPRHDVRLTDVDLALQDAAEFDAYALQRETEFTSRLLVRAMGYQGDASQGWWFCGRHQALADLAAWLSQDGGNAPQQLPAMAGAAECVRVVTAGPGSGKTALLGLVAALTMPERRRTVPVDTLGLDPAWIPHEGSIDVVMYAQNLTDSQVLSGLAAAAGFRCASVGEFLDALQQQDGDRERPFTVLIDALDEAATPDTLCARIVRPLIEHSRGRIRLLLGTRPYLLDRLGLGHLPQRHDSRIIDLDSPRYADRKALLAYTMRNLLQSCRTSPYRSTNASLLRAVTQAVGDAAGTSFLVARFAAYTLASAETVVTDPYSTRWRAGLPRHAGQAMCDDLDSRLGPDAQRATDLLRPLAYAEGQGLPWEDVWAPLASAISGRAYTDEDLLWLRHHAGSYVVEATESGRSAYRLYHQALTEHLREDTDPTDVNAAFVDTLIDCVPYCGDATRDWARAHPYTLNHLATHAAGSDRINDLLNHTEYLVHASPPSLSPHLQDASTPQARRTAAVYRNSYDLHITASPDVRRNLLALNAARAGADTLLEQLNDHARSDEWLPTWATGNDFTHALRHTLTGHRGRAQAVACVVLDGRPVAVIGTRIMGTRGGAYLWDLASGQLLNEPLAGLDGDVSALACTVLDDRPIAVIATRISTSAFKESGGAVYAWDLARRQLLGAPLTGFDGRVSALACTIVDGQPVAVIGTRIDGGGRPGGAYVWDLASGQLLGESPINLDGSVSALACTIIEGQPIAVIATSTGARGLGRSSLSVWDLASGQPLGELPIDLDGRVSALACTIIEGQPIAVIGISAKGGTKGGVYLWDLARRQLLGAPLIHLDSRVSTLACTIFDGRPVAVIGAGAGAGARGIGMEKGSLSAWDLASGQPLGEPLIHFNGVQAQACAILDGRIIAATIDSVGYARAWNVMDSTITTGLDAGFRDSVIETLAHTVLDGQPSAGIGTSTSTDFRFFRSAVYARAVADGHLLGEPLTRLNGRVSALACTVLHGRSVAAIATVDASDNGDGVYVLDLADGQLLGEPLTRLNGRVSALACTVLDGRPIAVIGTSTRSMGGVYMLDLASGQLLGKPLNRLAGSVSALACTVLDGRPIAVIGTSIESGSGSGLFARTKGEVHVWDLASGQLLDETLPRLEKRVQALACTVLDGRPIAVIGTSIGAGVQSRVEVWDLADGQLLGEALTGLNRLRSLECTVLDGRPLAVITTSAQDLYIWDIRACERVQRVIVPGVRGAAFSVTGSLVVAMNRDIALLERHSDITCGDQSGT